MPAFGNLTINDGASTPVAHTFNPVKIDANEVATWADRSSGVSTKFALITASNRDPGKGSQVYREQFSVVVPVVADGSDPAIPQGTVLRTFRANVEILQPASSTLQERKDSHAYLTNFLVSPTAKSMIVDLEHVY